MKQRTKRSINEATPADWDALRSVDPVNNPPHYNKGDIECIDGIEAMLTREEFIGYLRGNSLKYRWRFPYKNGIEDLKKAEWYEKKMLEILTNEEKNK